jgi:epoxyqueuosine reductase QueG
MKQGLIKTIEEEVQTFQQAGTTTRWAKALVGIAAASDPLFPRLKEVVSPSHALPHDLLPGARSVVAFFLPFAPEVGLGNQAGRLASPGWATAYLETNRLIARICRAASQYLLDHGHQAHATPATHNYDPVKMVSDWSHRHVAVITGLGTLGVHNLLITERGACGRLGSIVTTAELEPDPRPEIEGCLSKRGETCLRCVRRCVGQALDAHDFHRGRCQEVLWENERAHPDQPGADVCGKCLVKVPCSYISPPINPARTGTS